ncbi:unnamed protein product (macronuclear) [Paramecium tetraurelia]|uniref:Uncharacterized protein n=1 Tax=Paramecium tetraurelia TaxID=5888 RepID=A0C8C6_PARTE|nr:uncharacterized protein GSPATT00036176001 [Paramecium tetraurelia]CAK67043.1 unnamed protein product [Paramecium tetraurelia]|eukprot:XP_001434440.1 hypothetical protein (macronuclear) [Paramecium tetraurelia strain d4-2]
MLIKKTNLINLDTIQFYDIKSQHQNIYSPNATIATLKKNGDHQKNASQTQILCKRFEYNQIGNYTVIKDLNQAGGIAGFIILKDYAFLFSHYQINLVKECLFSRNQQLCVIISSKFISIYELQNLKLIQNQQIDWSFYYKSGAITSDSQYLIANTHESTIVLYSLKKLTQIITIYQSKANFSQIFVSRTNNVMFSTKFGSHYVKRWQIKDDQIKMQTQFYLNQTYTLHYVTKHYILVRRQFKTFESMYCIFSNLNKQRKLIRTIKCSFFENLQLDPNCESRILIDDGNKLEFLAQYKFYCIQTGHFKRASLEYNKLISKPSIEISKNQMKVEYYLQESQE